MLIKKSVSQGGKGKGKLIRNYGSRVVVPNSGIICNNNRVYKRHILRPSIYNKRTSGKLDKPLEVFQPVPTVCDNSNDSGLELESPTGSTGSGHSLPDYCFLPQIVQHSSFHSQVSGLRNVEVSSKLKQMENLIQPGVSENACSTDTFLQQATKSPQKAMKSVPQFSGPTTSSKIGSFGKKQGLGGSQSASYIAEESISRDRKVFLQILSQPEQQHRARYQTEGSRGSIKDRRGNGFPVVKLVGYSKPATLQIFIGTDVGKVAPHMFYQACKVSSKNSTPCRETKINGTIVIEIEMQPGSEMTVSCDCVGILKERNVDVEHRFPDRQSQKTKKKSTRCRMVFRCEIENDAGEKEVLQACSQPIICTQPPGVPEICKKSLSGCPASGGLELFIIGKNFAKDTRVVFRSIRKTQMNTFWEEAVTPDQEYLQQTHLICSVPAYMNPDIQDPVTVNLIVVSNGKSSESQKFVYTPNSFLTAASDIAATSLVVDVKQGNRQLLKDCLFPNTEEYLNTVKHTTLSGGQALALNMDESSSHEKEVVMKTLENMSFSLGVQPETEGFLKIKDELNDENSQMGDRAESLTSHSEMSSNLSAGYSPQEKTSDLVLQMTLGGLQPLPHSMEFQQTVTVPSPMELIDMNIKSEMARRASLERASTVESLHPAIFQAIGKPESTDVTMQNALLEPLPVSMDTSIPIKETPCQQLPLNDSPAAVKKMILNAAAEILATPQPNAETQATINAIIAFSSENISPGKKMPVLSDPVPTSAVHCLTPSVAQVAISPEAIRLSENPNNSTNNHLDSVVMTNHDILLSSQYNNEPFRNHSLTSLCTSAPMAPMMTEKGASDIILSSSQVVQPVQTLQPLSLPYPNEIKSVQASQPHPAIPQEITAMSESDLISFINPNAFDQV